MVMAIHDHLYQNGRRYQNYKDAAYYLPNDDPEHDRLDLQHVWIRGVMGGPLSLAPIADDAPLKVLDLGTGSGIWAKEFVEENAHASVLGVDLSPPDMPDALQRCRFTTGDVEGEWSAFTDECFDYIHGRMLMGATHDAAKLLSQTMDHLNPGGWVEWQEMSHDIQCACPGVGGMAKCKYQAFNAWNDKMVQAAANLGIDIKQGGKYAPLFDSSGLVNTVEVVNLVPIGPWRAGEREQKLGKFCQGVLGSGLEGVTMGFLANGLGMTKEEIGVIVSKVRAELQTPGVCHYFKFHTYYGQKPLHRS